MSQSAQGTFVPAVFNFQSHEVRVIDLNGKPWFVAADVARALNYRDAEVATRHLDDDEKVVHLLGVAPSKDSAIARTPGGDQRVTIINESGLYALVLRSRKPEARKFAKWVTSEVLPSIRQTGGYQAAPARTELALAEMLIGQRWLMTFGDAGQPNMKPVAPAAAIIDPKDIDALRTLIGEYIPLDLLPDVIDSASARLRRYVRANEPDKP